MTWKSLGISGDIALEIHKKSMGICPWKIYWESMGFALWKSTRIPRAHSLAIHLNTWGCRGTCHWKSVRNPLKAGLRHLLKFVGRMWYIPFEIHRISMGMRLTKSMGGKKYIVYNSLCIAGIPNANVLRQHALHNLSWEELLAALAFEANTYNALCLDGFSIV